MVTSRPICQVAYNSASGDGCTPLQALVVQDSNLLALWRSKLLPLRSIPDCDRHRTLQHGRNSSL